MNKSILCGRLTADPRITYTNGDNSMCIASWSVAVDRRASKNGDTGADFINCKAFGKLAEHVEKYWHKGMKMLLVGHIMTGAYNDKEGRKIYTTEVVADEIEFAESKNASAANGNSGLPVNNEPTNGFSPAPANDLPPFMNISEGDLPFGPVSR